MKGHLAICRDRIAVLEANAARAQETTKTIAAQRDVADARAARYLEILNALIDGLALVVSGAQAQLDTANREFYRQKIAANERPREVR